MTEENNKNEKSSEQLVEGYKERIRLAGKELAQSKELNLSKERRRELDRQIKQAHLDIAKIQSENLDLTKEEFIELKKIVQLRQEEIKAIDEKKRKEQEAADEKKKAEEEHKKLQEDVLKEIGSFFKVQESGFERFLKDLKKANLSSEQLGAALKESAKNIPNFIGNKVFSTLAQSTGAAVTSLITAQAEMARTTGTGYAYRDSVIAVSQGNISMGASIGRTAQAFSALHNNMSTFSSMTDTMKREVASTAIELENMGIAADQTGMMVDTFMRTMGQSATEARQSASDLADFAANIGVAPGKMVQDFASAMPRLAAYGKQAEQVFKDLAVKAKGLGLEMNDLLGITEQFDTFEGAASAAGKLNAILGGPMLDSMQLLTAESREQQVSMIQNALAMSGKSFDSMNRFEKMAIANALGIQDMSVATRLLSEDSQELEAEHEKLGLTEEELQKRREAGVDIMMKLKSIMEGLAVVVGPLVDKISSFVNALARTVEENRTLITGILTGIAAFYLLAKAIVIIKGLFTLGAAALAAFGIAAPTAAGGAAALVPVITALGAAGTAAAVGILAVGAAFMMMGIGVMFAAIGIALIVASVALLVYMFTQLFVVIAESAEKLPLIALGVLAIAGSLYVFGAALAVVGLGFAAMGVGAYVAAAGLLVLFAALAFMAAYSVPVSLGIGLIAASLMGLATALVLAGLGVKLMADGFASMAQSLAEMKDGGFDDIVNLVTVVESIDSSALDNMKSLVDEAERVVNLDVRMSGVKAVTALAGTLDGLKDFVVGKSGGKSGLQREIVLKIDEREFARAVAESLDTKMNMSLA